MGLFFYYKKCHDPGSSQDIYAQLPALARHDKLDEIKSLFKQHPDSVESCLNRMGCNLLRVAAMAGSMNTVKYLLTEKHLDINCDEGSALFGAAGMWRPEMVEYLLQNGAKMLPDKYSQEIPLHAAAGSNVGLQVQQDDHDFLTTDGPSVVKLLIEHGAAVDALDKDHETPLHKAAFLQNYWITKYLIEQKAEVNRQDNYGYTPLHHAAFSNKNNSICALLLKHGAVPTIKDNEGKTPVLWGASAIDTSTINLFVQYGYDPVNDIDHEGNMLLHHALSNGQFTTIDYLLDHKANVNAAKEHGVTPLHIAAKLRGAAGLNVIKKLINAGAEINALDASGHTPLYYISRVIELEHGTYFPDTLIVNYLRSKGAK